MTKISLDYNMGMEHGQPSYLEVLKTFNGFSKCDNEFTKDDFILHDTATRNFLAKRYKNVLSDITYSLGADLEVTVIQTTIGTIKRSN